MLTGGSEADAYFLAAPVKFGREPTLGAALEKRPHINCMRGSLTILGYDRSSKDEVDGIIPSTARLGTTMASDANGWHDICFYVVGGEVDRASVVSMHDPVKARSGSKCTCDDGRGDAPARPGDAWRFFHQHAVSREAMMAR